MAIKLAFSTVACPDWTLGQVVDKAGELGYQGVELRTLGLGGSGLACDPALSNAAKTASLFERAKIEPVCLSTSVSLHHFAEAPAYEASVRLNHDLELAAALGCQHVRIFGHNVDPGHDHRSVIQRIAHRAAPLADKAGQLGVQLLFENAGSFNQAKEWWWLLNLLDHPMLGMCWNVANAAAAGEPPAVSVPNLNSRIRLAKVKDTKLGEGVGWLPLGEGDCQVQTFIKRLLGIGFDGYATVEWDRLWLAGLAPADEFLPNAAATLQHWLDEIAELEEKGRKAAEKAAAKNAPKPTAAS